MYDVNLTELQDSDVNVGVQGLCLDWLQLVDPGVLADLPNLQADLIFAKGLAAATKQLPDHKEKEKVNMFELLFKYYHVTYDCDKFRRKKLPTYFVSSKTPCQFNNTTP